MRGHIAIFANNLAKGRGYVLPGPTPPHALVASAAHPPLFSCVLAVLDLLGLTSLNEQRIAMAVVGSVAVFIMGLLGREVAGPAVGIAGGPHRRTGPALVGTDWSVDE